MKYPIGIQDFSEIIIFLTKERMESLYVSCAIL